MRQLCSYRPCLAPTMVCCDSFACRLGRRQSGAKAWQASRQAVMRQRSGAGPLFLGDPRARALHADIYFTLSLSAHPPCSSGPSCMTGVTAGANRVAMIANFCPQLMSERTRWVIRNRSISVDPCGIPAFKKKVSWATKRLSFPLTISQRLVGFFIYI